MDISNIVCTDFLKLNIKAEKTTAQLGTIPESQCVKTDRN